MLTHLEIRNFALVERIDVELRPGMTVLTGETGAGKSILLDALGLALGNRADSGLIRHGADRAEISAEFEPEERPEVWEWLEAHDLEEETSCQIRRVITADGRSRGYINGRPAPLQLLRELGEMLVEIHGQHEHQSLTKGETQRRLLDEYAGNGSLLAELASLHHRWQEQSRKLEQLQQAGRERESRAELLSYQVRELEALGLAPEEPAELEQEHQRLANASRLLEECRQALELLYENEQFSAASLLGQASQRVASLQELDERLQGIGELLDNAAIQVEEAAGELRHYLTHAELNPERLQWVEERLATLHELARKHRVEPGQLPRLLPRLQQELQELEEMDLRLEGLRKSIATTLEEYTAAAERLTKARARAARELGEAISENMQRLGMEGGRFEIRLLPQQGENPTPFGRERVEFRVSANPGQPLKPLAKVASGGELARISLAIQVITAQKASTPTLIFDEVDVGIGGGVAEIVGRQLRRLGSFCQVICVTHQPQVAALAHHHLQVLKERSGGETSTRIWPLEEKQRVGELARMLGGVEMTEQTLSHAEEMLRRGQQRSD